MSKLQHQVRDLTSRLETGEPTGEFRARGIRAVRRMAIGERDPIRNRDTTKGKGEIEAGPENGLLFGSKVAQVSAHILKQSTALKKHRPVKKGIMVQPGSHASMRPLLSILLVLSGVPLLAGPLGHKVQIDDPAAAVRISAQGGRLIADYGSYQLYEVPEVTSDLLNGPQAENRDEYNLILLNAARLDTSTPEVQAVRKAAGDFAGKRMHLVQFAGPIQPEWRESLVAGGAQIVAYVPNNAYLVYGDAASLAKVHALAANAAHVQWEGPYLNDYRIHPAARPVDANGKARSIGTDMFSIQLVEDQAANAATLKLVNRLQLEHVQSPRAVLVYLNLVVRGTAENALQLANQPDVVSIQPYFLPKKLCERQDQIMAGNLTGTLPSGPGYLAWLASKGFTQAQFAASGFVVDVTDSGIDNGSTMPNHPALFINGDTNNPSRVIYNRLEGTPNPPSTLAGCDGHGTLDAHIIAGFDNQPVGFPNTDALGFHYGLGVCPFVRVGSSVIFDPDSFTFPNYANLQADAYNNGARISNNSWGFSGPLGTYSASAQQYDALVRDAQPAASSYPTPGNQEMVIVFAAGDDGPATQSITPPATAKNVIAVGSAKSVQAISTTDGCGLDDSYANSANDLFQFASRGPCTDGRHKPDLVAPAIHVSGGVVQATNPAPTGTADACFTASSVCALASGLFFPLNQEWFTISDGSSVSSAGAAGACALVRQYFINSFTNPPSPAMTKAYLMNSARYLTGQYANDTLWSDAQGMGEINLGFAFDGTPRLMRDQLPADLFTASGQVRTFGARVVDSSKPVRITLAWTDSPGTTSANPYNNDLDLTVTIGGVTYKGNVFSGAYSVLGGSADARDNVESVYLPAGTSGDFTVTVTAANINSDGVPNNGIPLDQDFALVMYNAAPPPPTITSVLPASQTVLMGQPSSFTVTATGQNPLSYQWRLGGTDIPGATASNYVIAAAQISDGGNYSVVVTNVFGAATSGVVTLTVIPTVPLDYALDDTLTWTTDPVSPWYGQTIINQDGVAAAQTFFLADGQQTSLRTAVTGPGTLTYWWKVSSETNADILTFSFGGSARTNISGEVDWQPQSFLLPSGAQVLQWTYAKDAANSAGQDAAWVDQVIYIAGFTLPFIAAQPTNQSSFGDGSVTFAVQAGGTPTLTYQWQFNGGNIAGATRSTFTVNNPRTQDAGLYSVLVGNAYGSTNSDNAVLSVVPMAVRGDNSLGQLLAPLDATNAIAVEAGSWHNLALRADGLVEAWGEDYDGQCDVPPTLQDVVAVAAGGYHSLALKGNRTVVGWGANYYRQAIPPVSVANIIAVAAGTWHSLGLRANGTVAAWGDNSWNQTNIPAGLSNVVAIAAGGNHSLALRLDGTVAAWGENTDSQGNNVGQSIVPPGLTNVVGIAAGDYHSLAVKADGTIVLWGDNSQGQSLAPANLGTIVALAGGGTHSLGLRANGSVIAWGNNSLGQCNVPNTLSNVVELAAGDSHTVLLMGTKPALPQPLRPTRRPSEFSVLIQTYSGRNYALEYKNSLTDTGWTSLPTIHGNGAMQFLIDSTASGPRRYYRVRQW